LLSKQNEQSKQKAEAKNRNKPSAISENKGGLSNNLEEFSAKQNT